MSVTGGRIKAQVALKDLLQKWDQVREHWTDDVALNFQETTLDPRKRRLKKGNDAIDLQPRECATYGNCGNWQPTSPKKPSSWPATACTLPWPPVMMKPATLFFSR